MKTIKEVRKELATAFEELKSGTLEPKVASEMNNSAGKLIKSLQIQLDYASLRGEKPEIDFLKCK